MNLNYKKAKQLLLDIDIKACEKFFKNNNCFLELGYCKLFYGNINEAKKSFAKVSHNDIRAHWALRLIPFIEGFVSFLPSYFQIRNFLEIDLNLLIKANQTNFVENIVNGADLFFSVNQESYKFISRVLINNNYSKIAKIFLDKGLEKCFNDPELQFILAEYCLKQNNKTEAIHYLNNCLNILPEYYPAIKKLNELNI